MGDRNITVMSKIDDATHLKLFEKLVDLGVLRKSKHGEFVHVHHEQHGENSLERIQNLQVGPDCVWVVGYPKTGSHFVQTILQNLGCEICAGMKVG